MNIPTLEQLATAHENALRNWCCGKCGGRLVQVYDQAADKHIVACGPNRCYPLQIRSALGRVKQEIQEEFDGREVAQNYPELVSTVKKPPTDLFTKE